MTVDKSVRGDDSTAFHHVALGVSTAERSSTPKELTICALRWMQERSSDLTLLAIDL